MIGGTEGVTFLRVLAVLFSAAMLSQACALAQQGQKAAVPDAAAQAQAATLFNEVYAADIAKARKPEEKAEMAKKLLQVGQESKDPANKYVVIGKARDLAAEGGDAATALAAAEELASSYQVDGLAVRLDALSKAARLNTAPRALAENASKLADEAAEQDRYDVARQLVLLASASAAKTGDQAFVKEMSARVQEVREIEAGLLAAKAALAKLAETPSDPTANLIAGKFCCFLKGDWSKGLPMLARTADETVRTAASMELAKPGEPERQVELADLWWSVAEKLVGTPKKNVQGHAAEWYRKALPLLTGLAKAKVEKRLADSRDIGPRSRWVTLADTQEEFEKNWRRGHSAGTVVFDTARRVIIVESPWTLGTFTYKAPWKQLSFDIAVERMSHVDLNIGGVALRLGPGLDKVRTGVTVTICYEEQSRELVALVNGRAVSRNAASDMSWSKELKCSFGIGGGTGKMYVRNARLELDEAQSHGPK